MLPELDVFDPNSDEFVHPERVGPNYEDLLFVTSADRQV